MHIMQSRRDFLAGLSAAGTTAALGSGTALAEGPPETTTIRIPKLQGICLAPLYVSDELLRAEGFTDIRYVETRGCAPNVERLARGDLDLSMVFAPPLLISIDAGEPITVLAGVHSLALPCAWAHLGQQAEKVGSPRIGAHGAQRG